MGSVHGPEDNGALGLQQFGPAVMDIGGGVGRDPGVAVVLVVLTGETSAKNVGLTKPQQRTTPQTNGASGASWASVGSEQQNHGSVSWARCPRGPTEAAPRAGRAGALGAYERTSPST